MVTHDFAVLSAKRLAAACHNHAVEKTAVRKGFVVDHLTAAGGAKIAAVDHKNVADVAAVHRNRFADLKDS